MRTSFKIVTAALLAAGLGVCASAGSRPERKALKVLMIGNSFSVCNVVHMPAVARAMGLRLDLASLYISGCSLERHWGNLVSNRVDAAFRPYAFDCRVGGVTNANSGVAGGPQIGRTRTGVIEALELADWDVVTIQQSSALSWRPESYSLFGDNLIAAIRELCPGAEIVFQETWSYTPWDPRLRKWGLDQDEMYDALHAVTAGFARRHGLRVIPMGTAVQLWRRELPVRYTASSFGGDVVGGRWVPSDRHFAEEDGQWVCRSDAFHLAESGEYLQSLVWTAALFGVDVTTCDYCPGWLAERDAALMKKVAMEAVSGKTPEPRQRNI